jgi:hypothetical protein
MNTRASYKAREIDNAVNNWVSESHITQDDIEVVEQAIKAIPVHSRFSTGLALIG